MSFIIKVIVPLIGLIGWLGIFLLFWVGTP